MVNKLIVLFISTIVLSCGTTLQNVKPTDVVYQIILYDNAYKPCYYKSLADLYQKKNVTCVEWKDVSDRLVIHPIKLKEILTQGIDQLSAIKNQEKPK